jgi:L-methionine (R)-S-oxide reductase
VSLLYINLQQTVAIIDIDCAELEGFDGEDQKYLEQFADIIARSSDF